MQNVEALISTITDEIRLGEQLLSNMAAQREAILAWNAATLLERLTEKELLLYKLQALTAQQHELLNHQLCPVIEKPGAHAVPPQLSSGPEKAALSDLGRCAQEIYARVQTEEQKLVSLLEHLLGHMGEVFASLAQAPVHVYGRNGTSSLSRPQSELIQGKA